MGIDSAGRLYKWPWLRVEHLLTLSTFCCGCAFCHWNSCITLHFKVKDVTFSVTSTFKTCIGVWKIWDMKDCTTWKDSVKADFWQAVDSIHLHGIWIEAIIPSNNYNCYCSTQIENDASMVGVYYGGSLDLALSNILGQTINTRTMNIPSKRLFVWNIDNKIPSGRFQLDKSFEPYRYSSGSRQHCSKAKMITWT